ncbi:MurR/RpiR family transcriptional regulator [Faecalibacillus faecis]|uniref:MurR/RpiR family transcriptional regulator n=1 Tax=Faecalibacillus faecis TaxID=1982628 RepID=UPI000E480C92|nr:MurR/RpiR family transcriptional regulator [Faecalibacillus faecis]RHB07998.1 MurR/RpiR family transcriptional regulator [Coprobacillus sp. AM42-12AC]RHH13908.1 MurR/RpiR family transcriptional regulator [Coprobacillus sp. AM18-4LB-d2]RHP22471.1 MurR/RpiR family transcriptional regulator [Coprobacillus sp. AF34-1BH]
MLIVNQIENTHFSKTEREIVDYIIDQGMNIEKMSANEIARNTFTSAPLLVRIAKKLGYSGFNEFKSAYLKELAYMLEETDVDASIPFLLSDDLMTISKNIALLEKETIQDTEQLNHHDELQHAISLLEKTKKIDVYGVLDNILLAKHFQTLMMDIGKDVQVIDQVTGQKRSACLADETHCAIIISYSGQTEEMLEVAEIYYKRQIPFISITCMAENSLSRLADAHLYLSSREMLHIKIGDFASTTSLKYLFDVLYAGIFSKNYKKNLETKIVVASYVDDRQSEDEYINEK